MAENARRGRYHPALEGAISPPPPPTAWLADPLVKPLSFVNPPSQTPQATPVLCEDLRNFT